MAWNPAFMDTGAHYTMSAAVTLGKWTSGTAPTAVTIAEDSLQGMRGGAMTKVLTGALGSIIVTRGASGTDAGQETIFKMAGTLSQSVRLTYDKDINRIILTTPDGTDHTSTQLAMQNGIFYTYEFAYLYSGGTTFSYALYVTPPDEDPIQILDVGSSQANVNSPSMTDLSTFHSTINGLDQRSFIACKQYSGSGPSFAAGDLYGNVSRGILYPDSDGRWPPTTPSRTWIPSTGSSYFGVLDETLASTSDYISEFTDVGGSPGGSPDFLDRASWSFTSSPSTVTTVPHVQFANLVQMVNGSATYSLYLKENVASDTATAITPLTAPATWTWRLDNYGTDPRNGSTAWTKARIDSLEVAIEPLNFT